MQIAQVMAGYSLGQADLLRRAMGKKKPEEMAKQRTGFLEAARPTASIATWPATCSIWWKNSPATASTSRTRPLTPGVLPDRLAEGALSRPLHGGGSLHRDGQPRQGGALDRGVSASWAYRDTAGRQCRWLQVHRRCRWPGDLWPGGDPWCGRRPIGAIVEARESEGEFRDLFDFCRRVDPQRMNKRTLEALIRAGALDNLGPSRAVLTAALDDASRLPPESGQPEPRHDGHVRRCLFDDPGDDEADVYADYRRVRDWSDKERLAGEKDTLGFISPDIRSTSTSRNCRASSRPGLSISSHLVSRSGWPAGGERAYHEIQARRYHGLRDPG